MKQTSLHATHERLGARMVEFGGWHMPVQYGPILDEVRCVREKAGIFDLGHMGRILLQGPDAVAFADRVSTCYTAKIPVGSIRYSFLCREDGNPIDDLLVYRDEGDVYMVVNASNTAHVLDWFGQHDDGFEVEIDDQTDRTAMIALQGQRSAQVLQRLVEDRDLESIGYYKFAFGTVCSMPRTRISRTGYTGEDGFEVYAPPAAAERLWTAILRAGRDAGVVPCGLGARDTLRLEAGMRLCGSDMDEQTTVLEAGLGWIVGWKKDDFMGAAVLRKQKADGVAQKLAAFEMSERSIARHGYPVMRGDERVGVVTSGTFTPYLKKPIGLARVPVELAAVGSVFDVEIRGRRARATVVPEPFYKRPKTG